MSQDAQHGNEAGRPAGARPQPGTLPVGKRRIGFALAALILLGMLIVPLAAKLSPDLEKWQAGLALPPTGLLNPGPVSRGHRAFEARCSSCHRQAFSAVPDAACTECHGRVEAHLPRPRPAGAAADPACTACHAGHAGKADRLHGGLAACVECHRRSADGVGTVQDFDTAHPDFRLSAVPGERPPRPAQEKAAPVAENPGIRFSHKAHLVKGGVSTPLGNTVLACRDCHRLEESGIHFAPVEMEKTCQQSRCHRQRFPEPFTAAGTMPHGSEAALMDELRRLQATRLAEAPAAMARECGVGERVLREAGPALDCIERSARQFAETRLFQENSKTPQCALCHPISRKDDKAAPWRVTPVRIRRDWHPAATFDHARHGTVECADCHDKRDSASSADVAMPGIRKCRECHAGNEGGGGRVASHCEDCHRFHRTAAAPR